MIVDTHSLTERDVRILSMLADGYTEESVASRLDVAPRTLRRYLVRLRADLGVGSTIEAVVQAAKRDII